MRFARLGAKPNRETEPSRLTSPHRATTTFPPPHPPRHSVPLLASQERGASDASAGRRPTTRVVAPRQPSATRARRRSSILGEGACDVLVATDVAARGLDLAGVELVVHADAPGCADAYAHRAGRAGRPRARRSRRQSPVTRAGEGRGGGARGVGTRRARGYSAVDGHRRDAREGKRRGDRGRGVGGGGGAARRVRRRRRGRGVLEECGGKGICRRGLYAIRPETRRFGFGCVGCVGCVFGRRDGAREGRRTYLGRGSVRRSGGGARGASARARRRAGAPKGGREGSRDAFGVVNRSCVPVACTSRAYQSCVPVVCTSRVYQSFQWWRWRDERSMRVRRGRGGRADEPRGASRIRAGNDFGFSTPGTCFETLIQLCLLNRRSPRRAHLGAR